MTPFNAEKFAYALKDKLGDAFARIINRDFLNNLIDDAIKSAKTDDVEIHKLPNGIKLVDSVRFPSYSHVRTTDDKFQLYGNNGKEYWGSLSDDGGLYTKPNLDRVLTELPKIPTYDMPPKIEIISEGERHLIKCRDKYFGAGMLEEWQKDRLYHKSYRIARAIVNTLEEDGNYPQ